MKKFEVEKKYAVNDLPACRHGILEEFAGQVLGTVQQSDQYLIHPQRDFRETDEALRIRVVKSAGCEIDSYLTYKGARLKKGPQADEFKTREEIEIPMASGVEQQLRLSEIMLALGFRLAPLVKKTRERIRIQYQGWSVEFALDQVEGLGSFLEMEVVTEFERVAEAQEILSQIATKMKLSGPITDSYLEMLTPKVITENCGEGPIALS